MECKKCGTVAPEGATYCPSCGNRVDGKKLCNRCGKANDESFKFCISCGARIDGKKACKQCGTEYEGTFCPVCGVKNGAAGGYKDAPIRRAQGVYGKLMNIIAVSLGLAAAFMAVIFMFFIGDSSGEVKNVFYYFKDSFYDLKEIDEMVGGWYGAGAVKAAGYFYSIAMCAVVAAMLASTIIFFVFTAIRSAMALCGKQTKSPISMAVWTVLCYVIGSTLIYSVEAGKASGIAEFSARFNGVTIAGLALCSVLLAVALVCSLLSDFTKFKNKSFIVRLICTGVCVIIGTVSFVLLKEAGAKMAIKVKSNAQTPSTLATVSASPLMMATTILGLFSEVYANKAYSHLDFEMSMISLFGILGAVCLMVAIVFGGMALFRNVRNASGRKHSSGMLWAIISFVFTIGTLVFEILMAKQASFIVNTTKIVTGSFSIHMTFTATIVALVFAFVNLGVAIAAKIVAKVYGAREE